MKKAYNNTWVNHIFLHQTARGWLRKNLLTPEQLTAVYTSFPQHFYRPGFFVTIGLFCFGLVSCAFFGGFISIFFIDTGTDGTLSLISLVCAASFLVALEVLIKERKLFHSGVDNALLYSALSAASTPIFLLFENAPLAIYCFVILVLCIPAILRYADILVTVVAFAVLLLLVASTFVKFPLGKALLPFALMLTTIATYFLARKNKDVYYLKCQMIVEIFSLAVFYLCGNYFVVREGNAMLNDLPTSTQIAFAYLFYFFTIAIPFTYIFYGLKLHDRILLVTGLITFGLAVVTYRIYFFELSPSQELTIAGSILIISSIALIRYLKNPKWGISDEPEERRRFGNLEAVLVSQTVGQVPLDQGTQFGGGNFGGGGAGEAY
jgi:hypothetical protein